jgi:cold shock CspA family protein
MPGMSDRMKTGTITAWNRERGYGFIETASGKKYFAHIQNWMEDSAPVVGAHVVFELGPGKANKPEQAVNVSLSTHVGADALKAGL